MTIDKNKKYFTINKIRLGNTRYLAKNKGSITEFANLLDRDIFLVCNWIGKTPQKNIGNRSARYIEDVFKLPNGWLDNVHEYVKYE